MKMLEKIKMLLLMLFIGFKKILRVLHTEGMRFVYNTQASTTVGGTSAGEWIGLAIGVMIAVLMLPPVADTVIGVNTSAWNFTGAAACKTLMYLIPLVYVAGVLVKIVKTALGK